MKFYEPFQRLDLAGFNPKENALYVTSTVTALIPEKSTLLGKDPYLNDVPIGSATIDFFSQLDDYATSQRVFEQMRRVKVLENVLSGKELSLTGIKLTQKVTEVVKAKYGGPIFYSVTAKVYNLDGAVGGQVTTTISQQGNIVII